RLEIRRINAPDSSARYGARQGGVTSAHLQEALQIGAEEFGWEQKRARSGQRNGSKVIGVGIGQVFHTAGASGFDGLVVLKPDGKLHIHTGVGNLGTYSYVVTARVAAHRERRVAAELPEVPRQVLRAVAALDDAVL